MEQRASRGAYQSPQDAETADVWPSASGSPGPPLPADAPRARGPVRRSTDAGPGHNAARGARTPHQRGGALTPTIPLEHPGCKTTGILIHHRTGVARWSLLPHALDLPTGVDIRCI